MESILDTTKKSLGIDPTDDSFDPDIIPLINTTIFTLSQMGIGTSNVFTVTSKEDKWSDFLTNSTINLEAAKSYIYLKTKLIFDPPSNSTVIENINTTLKELEWRMMLAVETNNLENWGELNASI